MTTTLTRRGNLYRWRKAGRGWYYHLTRHGHTYAYCGMAARSWGMYGAALSTERCPRCMRKCMDKGYVTTDEGSYRPASTDHHYALVQHIHAGTWRNGTWTSHPRTFSTSNGFEKWMRAQEARGAVVQWRFCQEDDERLVSGGAARRRERTR